LNIGVKNETTTNVGSQARGGGRRRFVVSAASRDDFASFFRRRGKIAKDGARF